MIEVFFSHSKKPWTLVVDGSNLKEANPSFLAYTTAKTKIRVQCTHTRGQSGEEMIASNMLALHTSII